VSELALAGGRYTLDRHLATGGMGTVYVATDTALSRTVAIKILKPEFASDRAFRTRFETEARHAAGLDHPGIAKVYDYGETAGETPRPYLVMEYVDGQPLSALLAPGRPLEPSRVVDLIAQTAEALQAAHDKQIVHRDVKPANLLITPDARVKVTDFGIAKAASDTPITQTGTIIGTAHYLPPEQAEGKPATPRSDIYALGVVLYECLTGTRPFVADNPVAIAIAHVRQEPPPLPDSVAPWLAALTMRMMAKDPAARPESAGELAQQLRAGEAADAENGAGDPRTSLLGAGATLTPTYDASRTQVMPTGQVSAPDTEPEAAPPDERRRRRLIAAAIVGAVILLALLIVGAVALLGGDDGTDSPEEPTPTQPNDDRPNQNDDDGNQGGPETDPNEDPTEPDDTEPTEPTDTEPTDTEPTETEPTDTEPTETEPTEPTSEPTTDETSEPTTDDTTEPTTTTKTTPTTESATTQRPDGSTAAPDEEDSTTP
jgi:eukaryotic-like serine/threonine-protein kinase